MSRPAIQLLLAHEDGGSILAEGLEPWTLAEFQGDRPPPVEHLSDPSADQNDLEAQGWGVVAPEGERGDRLLALIRPLVQHREEQQRRPVQVFRCPARMSVAEAWTWRRRHLDTSRGTIDEVPQYIVILGDLHEVPLTLQRTLAVDLYVGRLGLPDDGMVAYVDKLIRSEAADATEGRLAIHTVHDGTMATYLGYRALVQPALALLRRDGRGAGESVAELGGKRNPAVGDLLEGVRGDSPTALLTVSHGLGAPRRGWTSVDEQRARQGAMSFGSGQILTPGDVGEGSFLRNGVWVMNACFGAGTPESSAYHPWLSMLAEAGAHRGRLDAVLEGLSVDRPFLAALPGAALANPEGPLGVIGHVDLAWTYSMQDLDVEEGEVVATQRPGRYVDLLEFLGRGDRIGMSFKLLSRFVGQISADLAMAATEVRSGGLSDPVRTGHLHMLREDLAGFVVLGDPAARLSVAKRKQPELTPRSLLGLGPSATSRDCRRPELPALRAIEEAIASELLGEAGSRALAERLGVERATLLGWIDAYRSAGRAALQDVLRANTHSRSASDVT